MRVWEGVVKAERHLSGAVEAVLIRNGVTEPFLSGRVWEGVVKAERHLSGAVEAAGAAPFRGGRGGPERCCGLRGAARGGG